MKYEPSPADRIRIKLYLHKHFPEVQGRKQILLCIHCWDHVEGAARPECDLCGKNRKIVVFSSEDLVIEEDVA